MKTTLENLLCIIHRDGGHYISEHGLQKAFDDALKIHYRQRDAEEHLSTIVQQSLSGSADKSASPKSCSTCFGTGKQIHISSHDCLNCDGAGEVEHDF